MRTFNYISSYNKRFKNWIRPTGPIAINDQTGLVHSKNCLAIEPCEPDKLTVEPVNRPNRAVLNKSNSFFFFFLSQRNVLIHFVPK